MRYAVVYALRSVRSAKLCSRNYNADEVMYW